MSKIKAVITDYDLITAYGIGIQPLWRGILSGISCINKFDRFPTSSFLCKNAALIPGLTLSRPDSLVIQMLKPLFSKSLKIVPPDALLILATTVGEIDLLEKGNPGLSKFSFLLKKVKQLAKVKKTGLLVSCACASASTAIAEAARLIQSGQQDCVLVVAADAVSEFVFSGFSALMALDKERAKPFDKNRAGLSLGEAAGFALLMSQERAKKEKRRILTQVAGWGLSCDANHMTGPARNGQGLIQAMHCALKMAKLTPEQIGCISAHGTGTLYNDAMELVAFKNIFKDQPVAGYSIKGAIGHTLGAAGLIETILALNVQQEKIIPASVGLTEPDALAKGWISSAKQELKKSPVILNNCGFGGVNAALVLNNAHC